MLAADTAALRPLSVLAVCPLQAWLPTNAELEPLIGKTLTSIRTLEYDGKNHVCEYGPSITHSHTRFYFE